MAEGENYETASSEPGATAAADPAALTLGLAHASQGRADRYLEEQTGLVADQRHHIAAQFKPLMDQLRLGVWEKRLGVVLRVGTACMGLAFAAGLGFMFWNAAQSNRLLIEPFSVPPDLAANGLTGEVVAAKLLDRIVTMQAQTNSQRAARSLANSWGQDDIKLDIPETGLSLSQLDRFFRDEFGHDTHVRGEIVRTSGGLDLTARAGTDGAESITGAETDLDGLVQRLSESIYKLTQPYRFAVYLGTHERVAEALPIFRTLERTGTEQDRLWSRIGEGTMITEIAGVVRSVTLLQQAMGLAADNMVASGGVASRELELGQFEWALRDFKATAALPAAKTQETVRAELIPMIVLVNQSLADQLLGDYNSAAGKLVTAIEFGVPGRYALPSMLALSRAGDHDLKAASSSWSDYADLTSLAPGMTALYKISAQAQINLQEGKWTLVLGAENDIEALYLNYPGLKSLSPIFITPSIAMAKARLGRFAEAEKDISATPGDCYPCLQARAEIAQMRGQNGRADFWFARAVQEGPSIPFAYEDWGRSLLARGEADAAIAQFTLANKKGPHFADPLEGWGEALMAKSESHLALAKFAEAEKYAPNWGRLHLKWGEALAYAGKRDEAKAHFVRAAALDLTPAEKTELAEHSPPH